MASSSSSMYVPTLVEAIKKEIEDLPTTKSSVCIYKVPKELRAENVDYFTPKAVSIGPLHAHSPNLVATSKDVKLRYLKLFLSRLREDVSLEHVIDRLQRLEERARACYAEKISLNSYQFMRMLLIDGCFILQLLWKYENRKEREDDPIFLKGRAKWAMLYNFQQDLLLLENQLPFFVLCSLYELPIQKSNTPQALANSVINFFDSIAPNEKLCPVDINEHYQPKHLLDLVMFSLFPRPSQVENPPPNPNQVEEGLPEGDENQANIVDIDNALLELETNQEKFVDVRSVSELDLSGVTLTKCNKKPGYLTDITFRDGVLSIPSVVLLDSTASLFWNLLALEQCSDSKEYGCVVISYVSFMDNLICDNKDEEIFTRKGILQSWVNEDNEFLQLFNRMALAADMDGANEFSDISHQLERYCQSNLHPLRAYIVRNYFEVRWDLMNTVMLFIFTVTQTLFAILGYYGKGKH